MYLQIHLTEVFKLSFWKYIGQPLHLPTILAHSRKFQCMNEQDNIYMQVTIYGLHTQMGPDKRSIILCEILEA